MIRQAMATDALLRKNLEERKRQFAENAGQLISAKQTQSQPEKTASILRSGPCPCNSGENHVPSRTGQALSPQLACSR
jgi:hypothetical protein